MKVTKHNININLTLTEKEVELFQRWIKCANIQTLADTATEDLLFDDPDRLTEPQDARLFQSLMQRIYEELSDNIK